MGASSCPTDRPRQRDGQLTTGFADERKVNWLRHYTVCNNNENLSMEQAEEFLERSINTKSGGYDEDHLLAACRRERTPTATSWRCRTQPLARRATSALGDAAASSSSSPPSIPASGTSPSLRTRMRSTSN